MPGHRMHRMHGSLGLGLGLGHGARGMSGQHRGWRHLTSQQRTRVADRLDRRAARMHRLATCLRGSKPPGQCLRARLSRRQPPG